LSEIEYDAGLKPVTKVFISHQKADSDAAKRISNRVQLNGLSTYLDVVDDALSKPGQDLGDHIRSRMDSCTHLIAVVSQATTQSWWVPWEIGIATDRNFFISTYALDVMNLPAFLKKWPYLRSLAEIDDYVKESNKAQKRFLAEANQRKEFHTSLKRTLKQ